MSGPHPVASGATPLSAGDEDARHTIRVLRQLAGPAFLSDRILDFGCGAGRLTIPLARIAFHVTGVDSSAARIDEARANCERAGVSNVDFVVSDADLSSVNGPFQVVHSHFAFQHIPPAAGYLLVDAVLERVTTRGGGMLHFTYAPGGS